MCSLNHAYPVNTQMNDPLTIAPGSSAVQIIATMVERALLIESLAALLCCSAGMPWPLPQTIDPVGPVMKRERDDRRRWYVEHVEQLIRSGRSNNGRETLVLDLASRFGLLSTVPS
jgi:hypothetical protein